MRPPMKFSNAIIGLDERHEPETPSNNLWVGNLSGDVTDSDLMALFGRFGIIDSISSYSSRSYAFLYFKRVEDAKAAKDALQGTVFRGKEINIQFAKPAKPSKSLWVGGFGPSVSREALEKEFLKFGELQEFRFLGDRNTAFVDFFRLEDASKASRSLNGKRIGDGQIRVDFVRSQPSRKEHLNDFRDARGQFPSRGAILPDPMGISHDFGRNFSDLPHSDSRRQHHSQYLAGRKGDGQPSKVLWISYPPSLHVDDQMLHNAMILFGEIDKIKSFPLRNYAFVEFRSVDEARRAKEGLQGKLFNDPRITIEFSSSEVAANNDHSGFYPGIKGPRPDIFPNDISFQSGPDTYTPNHPILPLPPHGIHGSDVPIRPLGPPGSFDPALPGPEFRDLATNHKLTGGGANWRSSPTPGPGLLSSPPGKKRLNGHASGGLDVYETSQFPRESKRSRTDGGLASYDDHRLRMDKLSTLRSIGHRYRSSSVAPPNFPLKNNGSPVDVNGGPGINVNDPENDHVWRGIIAKGGTPVCCARCVPIGEGISSAIPETVNCAARTGLDMLAKHYADAVGFSIVFFLPDSEEDFASYTEFLRYLGSNNRAGVAKLLDGTNLFLVPPSDFLRRVLHVDGPERLYGVVLKFPQDDDDDDLPEVKSLPPPQPQYGYKPHISSARSEYGLMPPYDGHKPHISSSPPPKPVVSATSNTETGLTLTPELIATLASLLPANGKIPGSENAQPQPQPQVSALNFPSQYNPRQQLHHPHTADIQTSSYSPHRITSSHTPFRDPTFNSQPQGTISSYNFPVPSLNGQYHTGIPQEAQRGTGMTNGDEGFQLYAPPVHQQATNPIHGANNVSSLPESTTTAATTTVPMSSGTGNLELSDQVQQLQSAIYGGSQGTSEVEADKNERYRSTLQFAANLLLQIQQQQQQQGAPGGQGPANQ